MIVVGYRSILTLFSLISWTVTKTVQLESEIRAIRSVQLLASATYVLILSTDLKIYFLDLYSDHIRLKLTNFQSIGFKEFQCSDDLLTLIVVLTNGSLNIYDLSQFFDKNMLQIKSNRNSRVYNLKEANNKVLLVNFLLQW